MKTFILIAGIAASFIACNNESKETTSVEQDTVSDTTTTTNTTTTTTTYTPAEGDVSYRNGNVVVWRNNEWTKTDKDVTLDNGVVVHKDGKVEKDHNVVVLDDGEVVNKSGRFFDKAGNAIDNAWDATKEGAKKAGNAIEKGANKVGEKAKDVFDKDDKKEHK
jgi:hypothetical protein